MDIQHPENATRVLGASQGYIGLPIVDTTANCTVGGEGTPAMLSVWLPTAEELGRLNAGKRIVLTVLGSAHPPVNLGVEE